MSVTENNLWVWLKRARDYYGERLDIRRVENAISTGDADSDGVLDGRDFAIELKACDRPRGDTKLRFHEVTPAQVEWHARRLASGGATGFLIQVGAGPEALRYLVHGKFAPTLREGITENWLKANGAAVARASYAVVTATHLRTN